MSLLVFEKYFLRGYDANLAGQDESLVQWNHHLKPDYVARRT